MKKIISIVIVVTILLQVFGAVESSAALTYNALWVNGVNMLLEENKTIDCGSGIATFDKQNNILTLDNAQITNGYLLGKYAYGIYYDYDGLESLTIIVRGEVLIDADGIGGEQVRGIYTKDEVKIEGDGKLSIVGANLQYGIYGYFATYICETDLFIIGQMYGTIALFSQHIILKDNIYNADKVYNACNTNDMNGFGTGISNATLIANTGGDAIVGTGFSCSNATLEIESRGSGINALSGVTINNSTVDIKASKMGIFSSKQVDIKEESTVKIQSNSTGVIGEKSSCFEKSYVKIDAPEGVLILCPLKINDCDIIIDATDYTIRVSWVKTNVELTNKPNDSPLQINISDCEPFEGGAVSYGWERKKVMDPNWNIEIEAWYAETNMYNTYGEMVQDISIRRKPANYDAVNLALMKVSQLKREDYVDFSEVDEAVLGVVRFYNYTKQEEVDKMATNIETAISKLVLKSHEEPSLTDVTKIKFVKKSVKVKKGQKFIVKVKLSPDKLSESAKSVKWSINKKGKKVVKFVKEPKRLVGKLKVKIKALKKGKAKITCKAPSGKKAICTVVVK